MHTVIAQRSRVVEAFGAEQGAVLVDLVSVVDQLGLYAR